jgi:F420-0:gamma-glutamyl ligase
VAVLTESDTRERRLGLVGVAVRDPVVAVIVVGQVDRRPAVIVAILDALFGRAL